jgi:hypothetical protein
VVPGEAAVAPGVQATPQAAPGFTDILVMMFSGFSPVVAAVALILIFILFGLMLVFLYTSRLASENRALKSIGVVPPSGRFDMVGILFDVTSGSVHIVPLQRYAENLAYHLDRRPPGRFYLVVLSGNSGNLTLGRYPAVFAVGASRNYVALAPTTLANLGFVIKAIKSSDGRTVFEGTPDAVLEQLLNYAYTKVATAFNASIPLTGDQVIAIEIPRDKAIQAIFDSTTQLQSDIVTSLLNIESLISTLEAQLSRILARAEVARWTGIAQIIMIAGVIAFLMLIVYLTLGR